MDQQQGTPPAQAAAQAKPIDMPAVNAWFAEQAGKVGTPMTPQEMERWDEKSRAAWSRIAS